MDKNIRDVNGWMIEISKALSKTTDADLIHDFISSILTPNEFEEVATRWALVKLMAGGGVDNPNLSLVIKSVRDAKLTDDNVKDLVEFLKALSGKYPIMDAPELPQ